MRASTNVFNLLLLNAYFSEKLVEVFEIPDLTLEVHMHGNTCFICFIYFKNNKQILLQKATSMVKSHSATSIMGERILKWVNLYLWKKYVCHTTLHELERSKR